MQRLRQRRRRRRRTSAGRSIGCGVGQRGVRIAHCAQPIMPPLMHQLRLGAEERRLPQHEVGHLARPRSSPGRRDAVRDRRVDRDLGDVAQDAEVVVARRVLRQRPRPFFMVSAVWIVRSQLSPTRPIACESLENIEMTPMSWSTFSAAIVSARMRLSANATSEGTSGSRWWQTMIMSNSSASELMP